MSIDPSKILRAYEAQRSQIVEEYIEKIELVFRSFNELMEKVDQKLIDAKGYNEQQSQKFQMIFDVFYKLTQKTPY